MDASNHPLHDYYSPWPRGEQPSKPKKRWRFRFTLWQIVLLFVLISLLLGYLRTTRWGYVLAENVSRAGRSVGLVPAKDPNKVYISATCPHQNDRWEWSVEIPQDTKYQTCILANHIPVTGLPVSLKWDSNAISGGTSRKNYLLEVTFSAMEADSDSTRVQIGTYQTNSPVPTWVSGVLGRLSGIGWIGGDVEQSGITPKDGQQVFDPDERIVLLRQWPTDSPPTDDPNAEHAKGLVIWLEPISSNP